MIVPRETDEFKPVWLLFRVSYTPLAFVRLERFQEDLERSAPYRRSNDRRLRRLRRIDLSTKKSTTDAKWGKKKRARAGRIVSILDDDDDDDDDVSAPLLVAGAFPERFPDVSVRMESQ